MMRVRAGFEKSRVAFVGLCLLGIGSICAVILGMAEELRAFDSATASVLHGKDVLLATCRLEGDLQAAISEGRGFHITGVSDDLTRFKDMKRQVDLDLIALERLTADDPDQRDALDRLTPRISTRLAVLGHNVGTPPDDPQAIQSIKRRFAANLAMSQVSDGLAEINAEEARLLLARGAAASRARDFAMIAAAGGAALLSASVLMVMGLLASRHRERRHVEELGRVNLALERRVAERTAALRTLADQRERSEAENRRYLEHAPFAMMILTKGDEGRFTCEYLNAASETLHERPRDELLGRALQDVWPESVAREMEARANACLDSGRPYESVVTRETRSGTKFFDARAVPLQNQETGVWQVVLCGLDVTRKVELERQIQEQAAREKAILEREAAFFKNADDVMFIIRVDHTLEGPEFVYEAISPNFEKKTGTPATLLLGRRPAECFDPDMADQLMERNLKCFHSGSTYHFTATYKYPVGMRTIEGALTPLRDGPDGRIARLACWFRDITERVKAEDARRQAQKMEALGRLAAGVAHDFNNLLQSIIGSLEIALDDIPTARPTHDFIDGALKSALFGASLTQPLLTYAREQVLWPRAIDTETFLSEIRKLIANNIGPEIVVEVRMAPKTPALYADPGHLQASILNLATNASHAMPLGGTLILDARERCDGAQRSVVLTVSDTGTGMDDATLARATDPFFSTKGTAGTGLGLSLVKGFAEQSGGSLRITSRFGEGTAVELELPTASSVPESAGRRPLPWITGRVLVVDDTEDVLRNTATILAKAGFEIVRASGGNEALSLLRASGPIDAIVTDFSMPDVNGAALIGEVRKVHPDMPALVITGYYDLVSSLGLPPGVEVLPKPFDRVRLLQMLQRAMVGHRDAERVGQKHHA